MSRASLFRVGLVLALVPLVPTPLPGDRADPLPAFLTEGTWREYVTGDHTLVPVPLPEATTGRAGVRWAALTGHWGRPRWWAAWRSGMYVRSNE